MNTKSLFLSAGILSTGLLVGCSDNTSVSIEETAPAIELQDGNYSHRQDYSPQDGYDFYIDVDLTLDDQKISEIMVDGDMRSKSVVRYVEAFNNDGMKEKMLGKTIEEAKAEGYVSGASATSTAFESALDAIAQEATVQ